MKHSKNIETYTYLSLNAHTFHGEIIICSYITVYNKYWKMMNICYALHHFSPFEFEEIFEI